MIADKNKEGNPENVSLQKNVKKISRYSNIFNYLSISIAMIAFFIAIWQLGGEFSNLHKLEVTTDTTSLAKRILELNKINAQLKMELDSNIVFTREILKNINPNNIPYAQLKSEIESLKTQLNTLDKVILDNPEKAVSIPLLKQQLENEKDENIKERSSIKEEIARVYDMNKWIIGLVFTLLVSIIVLNVSNLLAKNKKG